MIIPDVVMNAGEAGGWHVAGSSGCAAVYAAIIPDPVMHFGGIEELSVTGGWHTAGSPGCSCKSVHAVIIAASVMNAGEVVARLLVVADGCHAEGTVAEGI